MAAPTAEQRVANRIGQAVEFFFGRLAGRYPGRPHAFRYQNPSERGVHGPRFEIAEKSPPGEQWPSGSNWKTWRGPTNQQLQAIEASSTTIEDMAHRIERLVFYNEDTTRGIPTAEHAITKGMTAADLDRMVADRVASILRDHGLVDRMAAGKMSPETAVAKATEIPQGLVKKKPRVARKEAQQTELAQVKEKCKILQIPEENIPITRHGFVDKRWLKELHGHWDVYTRRTPATSAPTA